MNLTAHYAELREHANKMEAMAWKWTWLCMASIVINITLVILYFTK